MTFLEDFPTAGCSGLIECGNSTRQAKWWPLWDPEIIAWFMTSGRERWWKFLGHRSQTCVTSPHSGVFISSKREKEAIMKKITFAAFVLALLASVPAHANDREGDHRLYHGSWDHDRDQTSDPSATSNPTSVPEPGSVLMLGSGLLTLVGIGLLRRKKAV